MTDDSPGSGSGSGSGGGRPDRWRQALGPLGALWVAGAAVALAPGHDPRRLAVASGFTGWPAAPLAAAATILAWVAVGLLAALLATPVAALWLGRWPVGAGALTARRRVRWCRAHERVERLAADGASAESQVRAIARRAAIAVAPPCRPTWIGDRWAAVEQRVNAAYGLDVVTVWPRLWLTLSPPTRDELRAAKAEWDRSTRLAAWTVPFGVLGLVWWPFLGIAAVVGVAGWIRGRAAVAYRADLVEATFDLHAAALPGRFGGLDPDIGRGLTADFRKGT